MLHTYADAHGRLVVRAWYETPWGKLAITAGTLFLLAVCLCWALDVMPVQCAGAHCAMVAP